MTSDLRGPLEAWQWDIRSSRLTRYEFCWPGDLTCGAKSEALEAWGFELELVATPAAHETGAQATVYSHFLPEDEKAMPFHYCIVLEMNTFNELVFAADLPELVDTLRYLEPIIKN